MKVYTTQVMVDLYDQIPYKEALLGAKNLTPHFDDGFEIYSDLLSVLDTALSKDFGALTNTIPGKQDLIFEGDVDKWNNLKHLN
jgi:hypothetical protein